MLDNAVTSGNTGIFIFALTFVLWLTRRGVWAIIRHVLSRLVVPLCRRQFALRFFYKYCEFTLPIQQMRYGELKRYVNKITNYLVKTHPSINRATTEMVVLLFIKERPYQQLFLLLFLSRLIYEKPYGRTVEANKIARCLRNGANKNKTEIILGTIRSDHENMRDLILEIFEDLIRCYPECFTSHIKVINSPKHIANNKQLLNALAKEAVQSTGNLTRFFARIRFAKCHLGIISLIDSSFARRFLSANTRLKIKVCYKLSIAQFKRIFRPLRRII